VSTKIFIYYFYGVCLLFLRKLFGGFLPEIKQKGFISLPWRLIPRQNLHDLQRYMTFIRKMTPMSIFPVEHPNKPKKAEKGAFCVITKSPYLTNYRNYPLLLIIYLF